jgi:hypothetical protein
MASPVPSNAEAPTTSEGTSSEGSDLIKGYIAELKKGKERPEWLQNLVKRPECKQIHSDVFCHFNSSPKKRSSGSTAPARELSCPAFALRRFTLRRYSRDADCPKQKAGTALKGEKFQTLWLKIERLADCMFSHAEAKMIADLNLRNATHDAEINTWMEFVRQNMTNSRPFHSEMTCEHVQSMKSYYKLHESASKLGIGDDEQMLSTFLEQADNSENLSCRFPHTSEPEGVYDLKSAFFNDYRHFREQNRFENPQQRFLGLQISVEREVPSHRNDLIQSFINECKQSLMNERKHLDGFIAALERCKIGCDREEGLPKIAKQLQTMWDAKKPTFSNFELLSFRCICRFISRNVKPKPTQASVELAASGVGISGVKDDEKSAVEAGFGFVVVEMVKLGDHLAELNQKLDDFKKPAATSFVEFQKFLKEKPEFYGPFTNNTALGFHFLEQAILDSAYFTQQNHVIDALSEALNKAAKTIEDEETCKCIFDELCTAVAVEQLHFLFDFLEEKNNAEIGFLVGDSEKSSDQAVGGVKTNRAESVATPADDSYLWLDLKGGVLQCFLKEERSLRLATKHFRPKDSHVQKEPVYNRLCDFACAAFVSANAVLATLMFEFDLS